MRLPWHQMMAEPATSYDYFMSYLELRKIKQVARKFGVAESTIASYKTKYRWLARAKAYDEWQQSQAKRIEQQGQKEKERKAKLIPLPLKAAVKVEYTDEDKIQIGIKLLSVGVLGLERLESDLKQGLVSLRPGEVSLLITEGIGLLNSTRPENNEGKKIQDYTKLNEEELEMIIKVNAKLANESA